MKTSITFLKSIVLFSIVFFAPNISKSQNWTVGSPVNMVVNTNLFHSNYCYPTADQHFLIDGSTISGISYYLYVNSAPLDSVYLMPGNDTLTTGDSILIPGGGNLYSLYFFLGGGLLDMSIKAVGVPTTIGQSHPCQPSNLWMSNLMICDEGLTPVINNNCVVEAGTSLIANIFGTNSPCFSPCGGIADASVTGGTFPYSYLWSNGETTTAVSGLCSGIYAVTVTDASSNTATDSVTITSPTAISIDDSVTNASCSTCTDGSISVTVNGGVPPFTIAWSSGSTTNSTINQEPGEYIINVTDSNGCLFVDTLIIGFNESINSVNQNFNLKIYPNPSSDQISINSEKLSIHSIKISNVVGQIIYNESGAKLSSYNEQKNKSISLTSFNSGIYFIAVQFSDGSFVVKQFVKE